MKNVTTLREALELVDNLDLAPFDKFALTNMLIAYNWMYSSGISINASFIDIIDLFLKEIAPTYIHTKEEKNFINELIRNVK